ncbi:MAG: FHA domain-containing protein [Bacteroidales bacterium]|nr:FHA domain-containing protein [Lachnoclostridium sp.]MCM1384201.1 FHA domain-containing protein [Lachnoclostridium sp.]MCM1464867.1 FHA domain-containing protein [Bacteroidales bacterium]
MLQTEFVKNLHSNYTRIQLEDKPEEQRYQYCILSRGGIKGLLDGSLRYLNGNAYLYYDITSKQNVMQLFQKRSITREWVKDFLWSFRQIQMELDRFLLNEKNVLWYPDQIYQDLADNIFSFLYIPYYDGNNGFKAFLEFLVEHINYEDEILVECVYKIYDGFEQNGEVYLQSRIFEDAKMLEGESMQRGNPQGKVETALPAGMQTGMSDSTDDGTDQVCHSEDFREKEANEKEVKDKRGIFSFFENKRNKHRALKNNYRRNLTISMEGAAVAEEFDYGKEDYEKEDYGRTIYIEEPSKREKIYRLYSREGKILVQLGEESLTIGKQKDEVDLVLDDFSISRIHARITKEEDGYYLEDMNSTNGTFKNGLYLQPYEKRKLQEDDEIRLGAVVLIFR